MPHWIQSISRRPSQAALLAILLLCLGDSRRAVRSAPQTSSPVSSPPSAASQEAKVNSATDIAAEAGVFYGKTVQVRSQVDRTYNVHAFTLSDEPLLAAPEVLVLMPQGLAKAAEGYMVTIVGTVRPFKRPQLEREYPWFRKKEFGRTRPFDRWEREDITVLVADSVRTESGLELVRQPALVSSGIGRPGTNYVGRGQASGPATLVDDIGSVFRADNSRTLVGDQIVLKPISVVHVINGQFITVGTDFDHQILARLPVPTNRFAQGDAIALSGMIELLPASFEAWGLRTAQLGPAALLPIYIAVESAAPDVH